MEASEPDLLARLQRSRDVGEHLYRGPVGAALELEGVLLWAWQFPKPYGFLESNIDAEVILMIHRLKKGDGKLGLQSSWPRYHVSSTNALRKFAFQSPTGS